MPFPVPTSVQLAVPVRRRRPCRFRHDDGLLGRRPSRFLCQRFLRRLSWHYLCRRPSWRSFSQRRPRLHRKRRLSSFVTLPRCYLTCSLLRRRSCVVDCGAFPRTDSRTTCRAGPSPTAVPLPTRRRPFRLTAVPLPAPTLPAPSVVALLGSTAVVPLPQPTLALGCIESDGARRSWHFRCYLPCSLLRRRSCVVNCGAFPRTDFRTTCRAGPSPTAMPLPTRRRPFRSTAVPLPVSTLPAPIVVALLVSTAVVALLQPTSPSAASKATALVIRDTSPVLSDVQPPAPTVVRSRLRCLSPYRLPYNLPCRSVADGRAASDSTTAF